MGASYEIIDQTPAGKAKVRYTGIDQVGYRDLEANEAVSQQSYAASVGNTSDDTVMIRDRDSGKFVSENKSQNVLKVKGSAEAGERGATQNNPTFEIDLEGNKKSARQILQENWDQWEAYQVYGLWSFLCREGGGDRVAVNGFSKVKDDIQQHTFRRPVVETVEVEGAGAGSSTVEKDELKGFEEVHGDTVDVAFREASDHAWSKVDCSVISWRNESLQLKLYAGKQSNWAKQAIEKSHIVLE